MFTKEEYGESVIKEIKIIKHLGTKITPAMAEYRPTPSQRSTLELMQFISNVASGYLRGILDDNWDAWDEYEKARGEVTIENFVERMDKEVVAVGDLLAKFTDDELEKEFDLSGNGKPIKKRLIIIETVFKWLVAYKMQLFLYIKANGVTEIGTSDLWYGKSST